MLVGSAVLSVVALAFESWDVNWTTELVLAFTYATIVPGFLATLTWFVLVNQIGAIRAATFHFLNPFFGVIIAAIVLGEAVSLLDLVGAAIIAFGILAVQLSKQEPKASIPAKV